ncbi:anthranilate synthase component I [Aminipila butyrica]|uniref:Anthranilate synthase component 1 n=1 Tax=Aminipila butyrica TaxID=433296 RepID=A0A858BT21_9FIRM|nr:anthranilate synthase component I [Aminipila butyrica]QIB69141.1 anthranilate synthase component I [Aminipila butyrica]
MYKPSLEESKKIAAEGDYKNIPVSCEIYGDTCTPVEILKKLRRVSGSCYLLESNEDVRGRGRYTFLGYEPSLELTCTGGHMQIKGPEGIQSFQTKQPAAYISQIIRENSSPRLPYLPAFTGGLVGYFSYDYIQYSEPSLKLGASDDERFKDVDLMLFHKVIIFDHLRHKVLLVANAGTESLERNYEQALNDLSKMRDLIRQGKPIEEEPPVLLSPMKALFSRETYRQMVERAKEHIRQGDIFQVVLSNRFEAEMKGSLMNVYRVMRTINPAPYMFFFSSDHIEMAGASPETLVKLEGNRVSTFPLAGTRPRGKTVEEDQTLEQELLADEKELAEHNMLVDLGRNDLGKISRFGTLKVDKYLEIEKFSHVMHIGSAVHGELSEGMQAMDAIHAVLPAGTLSGAPKIRACQIIHELEENKRGVYGGAIGYLALNGDMDTCIAIRLAFKKNGKVFVRSGAGIVADSVPEKEYQECLNKARAVLEALEASKERLES